MNSDWPLWEVFVRARNGTDHRIEAGGLAMVPRGIPHWFLVLPESARLLCLHTPDAAKPYIGRQ